MTIKEFRMRYSKEVAQVEAEARASVDNTDVINSAVRSERDRMAAIDAIAGLYDSELIHEAKYGEKPCTAAELAIRAKLPENRLRAARNQVKTILH